MATFKVPQALPQDILLISEFVDVLEQRPRPPTVPKEDDDDDIASSGRDDDSEEEIEKDLTALPDEDDEGDGESLPSDSGLGSDSSTSESESEAEENLRAGKQKALASDSDDDEDAVHPSSGMHPQTKNEIFGAAITIPDLEEVGAHEQLEKVGDVMSIVDNVVIVRGLLAEYVNRGSEKALDSDTLLVFGDRQVMGYIYETFGPTSQPFYQVKFNQVYPLNPEKVQIGQAVFHIPRRSHFVFVNQLKQLRGSDASNVHDEEPAEDELEFSDDEAEAAHRSRHKRKRADARARSVSSSRRSTPAPSQMRDQDMMNESILNKTAFDEHGPYDLDYGAGPSRPTPQPYDDPRLDTHNTVKSEAYTELSRFHSKSERPKSFTSRDRSSSQSGDGRPRGRGRGRGKRGNAMMRGSFGRDNHRPLSGAEVEEYDPRMAHESLPSPYLQNQDNYAANYPPATNTGVNPSWGYPNQAFGQLQNQNQSYVFPGSAYHQPPTFVQPHINPRFASAFGLQVAPTAPSCTQEPPGSMSARTVAQDRVEQWFDPAADTTTPKQEERTS